MWLHKRLVNHTWPELSPRANLPWQTLLGTNFDNVAFRIIRADKPLYHDKVVVQGEGACKMSMSFVQTQPLLNLCGYSIIILHTRLTKSLSSLFSDQFHIWHGLWVDIRLLWHVCVFQCAFVWHVCVCIVRLWVCLAWTLLSLVSWAQWGKNSCQTLSQCVSAAQSLTQIMLSWMYLHSHVPG